jgi:hypothetical protein
MNDKSNPNLTEPKREVPSEQPSVGGDHIVIHGNVGPGASVGKGAVYADQIAGNDLIVNGVLAGDQSQFGDLLTALKEMLLQAKETGELNEPAATEAITNLDEAVEMIKQEAKPDRQNLIRRLKAVTDLIDAAVDTFSADGGVAKVLLRALPMAALLVKLAVRFF